MASIERRADRKGAGYRVRYRTPEGQQRTKTFARMVDAKAFVATTEAKKLQGDWIDPAAGKVTLRDYAATWQSRQVHRESTAYQVNSHLKLHVLPFLGDYPMAAIRPGQVQAWAKERATVLAPSTLEVVYKYLTAIFRSAVADRVIARTPLEGVKLPKRAPAEVVPPTVEQVRALTAAMPARYRALVTLAAGTGLRQGEAFGLTVDRVDFLRRTLRVDRQIILVKGQAPKLAPPKTEASYRTVPLPTVVGDALAAHLAEFPTSHPDGLIFTTEAGEAIRRTHWNDVAWAPAVKRAGVAGVGFHDLRHFYASALIQAGESVKVVQKRLGHASAALTLDTYGHLWPDSDEKTRSAIDGVLGADVSQVCPDAVAE